MLRRRRALRAIVAVGLTVVGVLGASMALWVVLPEALLPRSARSDGWAPPFFLPAVLACALVGPLFAWWAARA